MRMKDEGRVVMLLHDQATLEKIVLFQVLTPEEKEQVYQQMHSVTFRWGETILRQGEPSDSFYIILSGSVRMILIDDAGRETSLGLIEQGNHFGEDALVHGTIASYAVRASTDVTLLRLFRDPFLQFLEQSPKIKKYILDYAANEAMQVFLKRSTLLAPLSHDELRSLLDKMEVKEYQAGETIVKEGEPGDAFYIIRTGSADVFKDSEGVKRINHLRKGSFFGELALLTGDHRRATVRAAESTTVYRLGKADFEQLISSAPKVKDSIISIASGYLNTSPLSAAPSEINLEEGREVERQARRVFLPWYRFPSVLQQSEMDCGPTCMAMVCRYYGKKIGMHRLRELAGVRRDGATLYQLNRAAEQVGFETETVKTTLQGLRERTLPAIVHWEGNHYIVVYKVQVSHVIVSDPAIGLSKLSLDEFSKGWTGMALFLKPTDRLMEQEEDQTTFARYVPFLKQHRKLLLYMVGLSFILQGASLALPLFTQFIYDHVLIHRNMALLNLLLLGMILIVVFTLLLGNLRAYLVTRVFLRIDIEMIVSFYRHVLALPMSYFASRRVGDILTRAGENREVRRFMTQHAVSGLMDLLTIVVSLALLFAYNVQLAFIALAFIPCFLLLTLWMTPLLRRNNRRQFQANVRTQNAMVESVSAIGTVKSLAAETKVRRDIEERMIHEAGVTMGGFRLNMLFNSIGTVLQTMNNVSILYVGARLILQESITIGELIAFTMIFGFVTQSALRLIGLWDGFQQVRIAMERLNDVYDVEKEEMMPEALACLETVQGHISMDRVTFRYDQDGKNILQNITLEMRPGETVALVGRSGSGKSTLAQLVMKLYTPDSGTIRIDGQDVQGIRAQDLRRHIGMVQQDNVLFSGTIKDNICYRHPSASMEDVAAASMLAGAHDFITALPNGYSTQIGERGASLSGGQKQRIAIARALLGNPRILIFDEATSALDNESEKIIQNNMDLILKDRTTLVIAHRLSTVRHADRIVVMDQGIIREEGTHEQLIKSRGLYHYLIQQQLG